MTRKTEKYLYIIAPVLILVSLFYYYLTRKFDVFAIATLVAGIAGAILFFLRFYEDVVRNITKRKIKYGVNSTIITLVVLALVVIVYLVTMDHNKRFDLTEAKRFSLSEQTLTVLKNLQGPVHAYAFYGKQQDTTSIRDLLTEYHYYNKDFSFEIVDPDLNPAMVKEMGVEEYGDIVLKYGEKREKAKDATEEAITNAIIKLSQRELKTVYFTTGHGEHSIEDYGNNGYDKIVAAIRAENYKIENILLLRKKEIPDDCALLVIAGPTKDYESYEIGLIKKYVERGGRVMFLMDPSLKGETFNNIKEFLNQYGLVLKDDVVIDPLSRVLSGDYFMPVINSYTYNPITKNFKIATFLKLARSVETKENTGKNVSTRIVASTGDSSWAETDFKALIGGKARYNNGEDIKGPVPVIAYARIEIPEKKNENKSETNSTNENKEGYIYVAGDSDFITNSMYQTQGNKDLFLNSVNFLANRGEMITIRPKQQKSVFLTMTAKQGRIAFLITMLIVPLLVIVVGLYINIQRRVRS